MIYSTFSHAIERVGAHLRDYSYEIHPDSWQSTDVSERPEAAMREILNVSFSVPLEYLNSLTSLREAVEPNLPWADDAFKERVSGTPWNPGEIWKDWPWSNTADYHRTEHEKFSHTYAERYWPKNAGDHRNDDNDREIQTARLKMNRGVRYYFGDLGDVVELLDRDPQTRQAVLPIFFPEDTGVVHEQRVPCSLFHHFILRNGYFHHTYFIRSCDFYRHFRDDLYLSVRLHLWVLDRLRARDDYGDVTGEFWKGVKPGLFTFHCTSMHCFINDFNDLFGRKKNESSI